MPRVEFESVEHSSQVLYRCQIVSLDYSIPHYHRDYEILFLLKGKLKVVVNERVQSMNYSDILLINSSDVHSISSAEDDNLCLLFQFSPRVLHEEYGFNRKFYFDLNSTTNTSINNDSFEGIKKILALIGLTLYEKEDGYQYYLKSYFYQIIGDLFSNTRYRIESENASDNNLIETYKIIIEFMQNHFKEDLTVDQICRTIGISKSTLYRTLSSISATTFHDLINLYRIEYSKDLLKRTEYSLSYIAQASGFLSDVSFFRLFKKHVGYTPSVYRANKQMITKQTGIQGYHTFPAEEAIKILKRLL